MSDAVLLRDRHDNPKTAVVTVAGGEIHQLHDGRAGVRTGLRSLDAGDALNFTTTGKHTVTKTASQVWIQGSPIYWDHSANAATCIPPVNDRDFYLGVAGSDAASDDETGVVDLNVYPAYIYDVHQDGGDTAVILSAGTPYIYSRGGSIEARFSATAEAQKLDILSKRSFPVDSRFVLEAIVEVVTNADADVADLNVGVANATHASDADDITESCFFHFDMGADLNIDAESDDGTTEVAATDTTVDFAVGTAVYLVIDGRDHEDLKLYVNGVRVLSGSTFTLADATGPMKALFHLEKSSNDSPGVVQLDALRVRITDA